MDRILKVFRQWYEKWQELIKSPAEIVGNVVSADAISISRVVGAPIVVLLSWLAMPIWALASYTFCMLTDAVDGAVAAARGRLGFNDDPKFGKFIDPISDKIAWLIITVSQLIMVEVGQVVLWVHWECLVAGWVLVVIETVLIVIRVSDYGYERSQNDTAHNERLLGATNSGKFKFVLEAIGTGGLVYFQPGSNIWPFYVAAACYLLALPLAYDSIIQKLRAR